VEFLCSRCAWPIEKLIRSSWWSLVICGVWITMQDSLPLKYRVKWQNFAVFPASYEWTVEIVWRVGKLFSNKFLKFWLWSAIGFWSRAPESTSDLHSAVHHVPQMSAPFQLRFMLSQHCFFNLTFAIIIACVTAGAVLYYYTYKRTALRLSDPRFYQINDWIISEFEKKL